MKETFKKLLQNDKRTLSLMALAVATVLLMLIGATYAYFSANMGGGNSAHINAITGTTDSLSFSVGNDINLHVTEDEFQAGMESPHGETTATATLRANNATNQAKGRYNVFFIIDHNDFEYSTADGQTELLMKVTDPNGNEVENITGLKRVEGGFDITTCTGSFLISADNDIETTSTTSKTWTIEVTFVNLNADQNKNKGKAFNGKFYITTEQEASHEVTKINSVETNVTHKSITVNLNYFPGSTEIEKFYYAIEKESLPMGYVAGVGVARLSSLAIQATDYIESTEASYTFENLEPNTKYKIYSYAVNKLGLKSNVYETSIVTGDYTFPQVTNLSYSKTLTSITVNATAVGGTHEVSKYYFSNDNGATWSEGQTSNSYTFDNLLDTTEYKIKVKVEDTNGEFSTEYYEAISTDVYDNPSITIVNVTKTYNSIDLVTTAVPGTNAIAKYYYKINDGDWSEGETTNTYHLSDLAENTTYIIYVKVEDTNGRASNEYRAKITTNAYVLPTITKVETVESVNSITINATAIGGDGNVVKYHFSKDNGSTWEIVDASSYTFEDLTIGVTFPISVMAEDNNGRLSAEYKLMAKTLNTLKAVTEDYMGEIWGFSDLITKVVFEDSLVSHTNAILNFDVSASGNGDIKAYLVSTADDELTVYIQSNGKILANPNSSNLFLGFVSLASIEGLENLDTSYVTNMSSMFFYCASLTGLDLSSFDTSKVTDMSFMFYYCASLLNLDLSSFNTSKVTNMASMFDNVQSLPILDVSNFDTSNVINMSSMFNTTFSLTGLDLSGFDTSSVTDMSSMFYYCANLLSLDLRSFDTSSVTDMSSMFYYCVNLSMLDLSSFNTSSVTDMSSMFNFLAVLTALDLSGFDTSNVTTMYGMFANSSGLFSIDLSNFDTSNVTNMYAMFWGCISLNSLDLSSFDTSNVTTMSGMFGNVGIDMVLTSITFGNDWNTSNVTDMSYMFQNCSGLTSIDLSRFDTSQVTTMAYMFHNCSNLTSLNVSDFDTSNVTNMYAMFYLCSKLTNLDLSNFDTSKVTTMAYMFSNCSSLTSLNVSNFNTSNVTTMGSMFDHCSSLTDLYISNFDTSNVNNMSYMFSNCNNLTSLNVSGFDTSKVINMSHMFFYDSGLTGLNLSNFDTSKVTTMAYMFGGCTGLTSLNVSSFDTLNVLTMQGMFYSCSGLTSLNLSNFDTSNVTNMTIMFRGCSNLSSLDLSGFDTSNVATMNLMFYECTNLNSLDVSSFDTSNVTTFEGMFGTGTGTMKLTDITFGSKWNTAKATTTAFMFQNCNNLTSLDLSMFDTSNVTDVSYMFFNCSGLTSIDLSGADFTQATTYTNMFYALPSSVSVIVKDAAAKSFVETRLGSGKGTVTVA